MVSLFSFIVHPKKILKLDLYSSGIYGFDKVPLVVVALVLFIVHPKNLLQLDLYSNGIYGFDKVPLVKGSLVLFIVLPKTFYGWTCIGMEYMVSIKSHW